MSLVGYVLCFVDGASFTKANTRCEAADPWPARQLAPTPDHIVLACTRNTCSGLTARLPHGRCGSRPLPPRATAPPLHHKPYLMMHSACATHRRDSSGSG